MKNQIKRALAIFAVAAMISVGTSQGWSGVFYPDGATTLHFAFEGSPNGDRPIIRAPGFYRADDGFGFVDSPELIGTSSGVTAPKYFRFDVNLPPGTYEVTVVMGGTQNSTTTIKAEGQPTSVVDVPAAGRGGVSKSFTVVVKRGEPGKTETIETDARLNLEFTGTNPSLMKLDIKPSEGGK